MPTDLRTIKDFETLLNYLRDDLDWPVENYTLDELTFEYEAADLGLKDDDAAQVKSIHQLRPVAAGQPWGIFFVEFEKRKIPVAVLRRILAHLVVKKRASAKNAHRASWNAEDILFITAFGNKSTDQQELAFAHFRQEQGDLPTLKVLGWDGSDTLLKVEQVSRTLSDKLRWPDDPSNYTAWRAQWSAPFRHRIGHIIRTADTLAEALAALAKRIRSAAEVLLAAESEKGQLTKLFKDFQSALIHDLTPETFADTYAQTITYGLLTAAINRTPSDASSGLDRGSQTALTAHDLTLMVRVTSPFLKEMLETFLTVGGRKKGLDFDELGIQDVVELLRGDETHLPDILRDFGNRTRGEDPVIHFYEHFLSAYNKKLKIQRGVFYTPQPVVSYIVRSVHELLQTEFGLEDGLASTVTWGEMLKKHPDLKLPPLTDEPGDTRTILADEPFVQILDPATGTATFLVEVVDAIFKHLKEKWDKGGIASMPKVANHSSHRAFSSYWNAYVPQHLLPRLHGYELLAAPYAIAHLKLGLKLTETGYRFGSNERARIYLTNALEPKVKELPLISFEPLAHEAKAVNEIKWYKRFTVVIGNPPYARISSNMGEWASKLIEDFKYVDGKHFGEIRHWLHDDYVKFLRLSYKLAEEARYGIIGMITNRGYLSGPTFRGMRNFIWQRCSVLSILDLHGGAIQEECKPPAGQSDENVFEIKQGVAISISTVMPQVQPESCRLYAELWGDQRSKYYELAMRSIISNTGSRLTAVSPRYDFVPRSTESLDNEYSAFISIDEFFPVGSTGIQTSRDAYVVDFEKATLAERFEEFCNTNLKDDYFKNRYSLGDGRNWNLADARNRLKGDAN